jgi:hypothetical protein
MSETYTKLFSSILRSSIWLEDDQTVRVWVAMLALADRAGYVGASVGGLAAQARVPRDAAERAIEKFLAPDQDSRSKDFEGRRIEVADRGWILLNYERFRDMRDEEARKEYERKRKAEQRAKAKGSVPDSPEMSRTVPACHEKSAQAEAEAEAEASAERISSPSSQDLNPLRNENALTRARGADFHDSEHECPCPLNLMEKARERGVLSQLARDFDREPEWVDWVAHEFVTYWTIGKGSGRSRKHWMTKLRDWARDKHGKGEGPAPGAIAHQQRQASEERPRPERRVLKDPKPRAVGGAELARNAIETVLKSG